VSVDATVAAGVVAALARFPVKSMLGEDLAEVPVTEHGILGDRAYALIDIETGKVASAKSPRRWSGLLDCRATFTEPPAAAGDAAPPVQIELPDGTTVRSDAADVDTVLTEHFGRAVTLATAAPEDFTIDQYHPDLDGLGPAGHRDTSVEQRLGAAFFAEVGLPSAVPVGSFLDLFPVSVLTTSTLEALHHVRPESSFDPRRFRMNLVVETHDGGFVENGWLGREIAVGAEVRLVVFLPDPRCVMTTLAQGDLPRDNEVLRTVTLHNRLDVGGAGSYPCAGVYAVVGTAGTVRRGDPVLIV
jgi:uncharacterized protein YcbX